MDQYLAWSGEKGRKVGESGKGMVEEGNGNLFRDLYGFQLRSIIVRLYGEVKGFMGAVMLGR